MKPNMLKLAEETITEKLTQAEFEKELKTNPGDFAGFRMGELEALLDAVVDKCCSLVTTAQAKKIRDHFDAE